MSPVGRLGMGGPGKAAEHLRRLWVIPAVMLVTSACGSRMDRSDIEAAERGSLAASAASSQTGASAPTADATGLDSGADTVTPGAADTGSTAVTSGSTPVDRGGSAAVGSGGSAVTSAGAGGAKAGATGSRVAGSTGGTRTAAGITGGAPGTGGATPARGGTATPRAGSTAAAGPANKAPVAVGSVATLSGPLGAFTKDYIASVQIWAKYKNSQGGINGHPIRHLVTDDGGDPSRYNAAVRQMVEEQGVIAFIHNTLGFAGGDLSYANQKRIPLVGHEGGVDFVYDSPMVFTPAASGSTYAYAGTAALAQVAVPAGKTKLAVLSCSDVKLCDTFYKVHTGPEAKALGFEVVYTARPSLTQPDFTGECLSARQAGANVMILNLDNNSMLRVARSCARQNYKPQYGYFDNVTLPSVAADPLTDGAAVAVKAPPWMERDVPGLAEIHQAFASAAPGVQVNAAHVNGWVSAKTFEVAARNLADRPTSEDILKGLWAIQGDTLGGLTYPLYFPKDQGSPKKACWGVAVIKDKKFVAPYGSKLTCK